MLRRFADAAEGLATETALLERAASPVRAGGVLVWTAPPALVVPRALTARAGFAAAAKASAARGWPVHLRGTGGGPSPQGPGVLNLALALPRVPGAVPSIAESYALICAPLERCFAGFGVAVTRGALPGAFCDGAFNLLARGRKLAGTAQRWRQTALLAHAVILLDGDLAGMLAALDALQTDLGLAPTGGVALHTTLRAERALHICPDTLAEGLTKAGLAAIARGLPES